MLELGKVYAWDVISKTYPDMYAIITDEVCKDRLIRLEFRKYTDEGRRSGHVEETEQIAEHTGSG